MDIFEQILIIFLLALGTLPLLWWRWRQRLKYLQKMAKLNILKRQQKSVLSQVFISYIIDACVQKLYITRHTQARNALAQLVGGRINASVRILQQQDEILAALLSAHQDAVKALRKMAKMPQKKLKNSRWFIFVIIAAQNVWALRQANHWFAALNKVPKSKTENAYYNLSKARHYMQKGDMAVVSKAITQALPVFHQQQYFMEETACYMLLIDVYRVSGVEDMSTFLLASIQKIYQHHNLPLQHTEITAMKGMLLTSDCQYAQAEICYQDALKLAPNMKIRADVLNQYALLEIHQQKYTAARKKIKQALNFYNQKQNSMGIAFSLQLMGQISFECGNLTAAAKYSQEAAVNYYTLENFSAYAESLYLAAEAYFQQQKFNRAENLLQEILSTLFAHQSNFHLGHVYGLLGLIYKQYGDYTQAKIWLKKSLWLEQNTQRYAGAAIDCLNLALIEQNTDNQAEAQQYSAEALEYAQKTENEEFIKIIKNKMLH